MKVILTNKMVEEPEIAVVGTKGQIVIPQQLREELSIKPKTKLALYRRGDKIVIAKLEIPPLVDDLKKFFEEIDEKRKGKKRPTEREILEEIQAYRGKERLTDTSHQ
jgi:AbrB family looped-hinge helix DNA binding protein